MESSSKGAEDGCTRVKFSRLNLVDLAGRSTVLQFQSAKQVLMPRYAMLVQPSHMSHTVSAICFV